MLRNLRFSSRDGVSLSPIIGGTEEPSEIGFAPLRRSVLALSTYDLGEKLWVDTTQTSTES